MGVIVAMVAITLVAVIVVIIKVILVHSEVNRILIVFKVHTNVFSEFIIAMALLFY